ncbi:HAMP domain-containing sensor histidine kinase [Pseudoalteromonas sp. MMG022]|uniref:sensor histidine kinase n=1 Tax=Pseudoalteromonas sp. MMG022 TaxID=2909978 RepID=UPI001F41C23E|nr:HAMP domain-containing sensor histidine kinase [Pseudoalteromonas sp. MMG022]MCF6434531.1 HAMP domain-containing histidine kinase [Pseudoalteromonas sp. MMG022]
MMTFKDKTLEAFIAFWLLLFVALFSAVTLACAWYFAWLTWQVVLSMCVMLCCYTFAIAYFRQRILLSFHRALLHIESIKQEDYKQYAKPAFPLGVVGKFHQHLRELSEELSIKKQRYDQHAFLVYQLIDQLETPVMVINQKDQLSYANGAFSLLYDGQPWQRYRNASLKLLGLLKVDNTWQLLTNKQQINQQWQISHSIFIDAGRTYQLLIFTNIESTIRNSQDKAWRQMVNVMGHEIRNSLTPVSSIAESLSARATNQRDQDALALISERCMSLQNFINRYASLTKEVNLHYEQVFAKQLAQQVKGLFEQRALHVTVKSGWIWADRSILEQVLINLVKNALEAGAETVDLVLSEDNHNTVIKVIDDGHGFANEENLFVPLFTTKQEGQGIGLSFCRNVIEQHNGSISLVNNPTHGVTVTITIPLKSAK